MDWSPRHLMSITSLCDQPRTAFIRCLDCYVFGFDTDAATGVDLTSIVQKNRDLPKRSSLYSKKYTIIPPALHRCCAPAVGLTKGMS